MRLLNGKDLMNPDNTVLVVNGIEHGVGTGDMEQVYLPAAP